METSPVQTHAQPAKRRRRRRKPGEAEDPDDEPKRRVVTTACIACRKRKSKCDGNTPACAACLQVYNTPCIYDPNSDHRRKGVYKRDIEGLKTKESTLQTIVQAILNYPEDEVPDLVRQIRTCESLDEVAETIVAREYGIAKEEEDEDIVEAPSPISPDDAPNFESKLGTKMGELRLDDGSVRYIGGTSHLLFLNSAGADVGDIVPDQYLQQQDNPITSWTEVTSDPELITHLLNMYFTWHYSYFTCLSRSLFYRDFLLGRQPSDTGRKTHYCSPLLVNAMLALGCHFTSRASAREDPSDLNTAGDHFFREAKRLIIENDEYEKPKITTVQALALMSVREAGCGREAKGWVYSGMSFRMALDMGLHLDSGALAEGRDRALDEGEGDARRITFWGCFLFDKCWSNYLGRLPQLPASLATCPKYDVFPDEDSAQWMPYSDIGASTAHTQSARTRAVALQISGLCEISGDLMRYFYNPGEANDLHKQKGKQAELKKLSDIQIRLESWRRSLPKEMEPREGALPSVFIMHMFYQLLFIHLFRPFLQYTAATSPLPPSVSPRKLCTTAASTISRLFRLYKRSYGLRQICNICVYFIHTACTIHLLNLPDKDARRDIVHGIRHLEEIAECWPCAQRTLAILDTLSKQWKIDLPEEASTVLIRCNTKFGPYSEKPNKNSPALRNDRKPALTQTTAQPMSVLPQQPSARMQNQLPIGNTADTYWNQHGQSATLPRPLNLQPQHQFQQPPQRQQFIQPMAPPQSAQDLFPSLHPASTHSSPAIPAALTKSNSIDSGQPHRGQHPFQHTQDRQQYHQQQQQQDTGSGVPTGSSGHAPSAGDMFGGVEQLLRDVGGGPGEWMVRDQSALAWGFGNWDLSRNDPDGWLGSAGNVLNGNGNTMGQGDHGQDLEGMDHLGSMDWNEDWAPQ
ncbi:fungal-specific transcription factor domain-containing protein [Elsinoe ampelina]|uniref:Fungal-specific transcription factor domain-containing protein n=1 Tax=Elsinoe ampelina TaxID=302913 RepID=A0A6A6GMZ0_9PEZI|nr:fungal-specific transcription factor domain-containing protein [Elsinoe ampelina]